MFRMPSVVPCCFQIFQFIVLELPLGWSTVSVAFPFIHLTLLVYTDSPHSPQLNFRSSVVYSGSLYLLLVVTGIMSMITIRVVTNMIKGRLVLLVSSL